MGAFHKLIWIKSKNILADGTGEWFKIAGRGKNTGFSRNVKTLPFCLNFSQSILAEDLGEITPST